MKLLKSLYFIILTGFLYSQIYSYNSVSTSKSDSIFVEAEKGLYDKFELRNDSNASGGKYLTMDKSGSVKWSIYAKSPGYYSLKIGYRTTEGDKEEFLIKNSKKIPIGLAYSSDWTEFETNIRLKKGRNSLILAPSWGDIDIDYIKVTRVHLSPEIKPKNNFFYKDHPSDISIKINLYEEKVKTITSNGKSFSFYKSEYPYQEDAEIITFSKKELSMLPAGNYAFSINMVSGASTQFNLRISDSMDTSGLIIVEPYIEHGASTLFILPDHKILLVDCGKDWIRDSIIIPMLVRNNIKKIDYFFITHYHNDHESGDSGKKIKSLFNVENFYDYKSFNTGDTFNLSGVNFKILNCYQNGEQENTRSLSFKMEYNGFIYVNGGDTYALNQERMMKDFPNDLGADVFHANHHFHGSIDTGYLRALDPVLVIIQAQQAIYARSAYMDKFRKDVASYLIKNKRRFIEELPTLEVGTVVIRVNSKNNWTYECLGNDNFNKDLTLF